LAYHFTRNCNNLEVESPMDRLSCGFEVKVNAADDGTFYGYGSVFGNVDDGGDIVAPGAFKSSLTKAKKGDAAWPAMLLQHGGDSVADKMPVGVWTDLDEDSKGLIATGKLALKTSRGADAYELMKLTPRPALDGLSIGYRTRDFELHKAQGKPDKARRTLKAVDLHEISLVTFPMNRLATVTAVKAAQEIKTIREFEDFLRDVGGFSNAAAKSIASSGFKAFSYLRDEDDGAQQRAAQLRALAEMFNPSGKV
jgi:HK97 family phage prohead protease